MAEADSILQRSAATQDEIGAVAGRIEDLFHTLAAAHDLCNERICSGETSDDSAVAFVLLRALLRGAARDTEVCVEVLRGKPGGLGYFEGHFGAI